MLEVRETSAYAVCFLFSVTGQPKLASTFGSDGSPLATQVMMSSSGNPALATVLKVVSALGLKLHVSATEKATRAV